ncbi:hypothetical protein NLJ89_g9226 [Agrocybe chaxingu]|uniref:3'-5' exonuclease n=1 Tax=Agrocybe chaxingu TaxID=84603 RepID=A0A9W8JTH3_9AGAR|nr:hypothetical protein NLJ89_g9226 [Agrocybe chaxingu]
MESDRQEERRGRGRPKGSKNGPDAGAVGRPRKDGQPPQKKRQRIARLTLPTNTPEVGAAPSPSSVPTRVENSGATENNEPLDPQGGGMHEGMPQGEGNLTSTPNVVESHSHMWHESAESSTSEPGGVEGSRGLEDLAMAVVDVEVTAFQNRVPLEDETFTGGTSAEAATKQDFAWALPKGMGLRGEYDDLEGELDEDGNVVDLFGESGDDISNDFEIIPDDDELVDGNTRPSAQNPNEPHTQAQMPTHEQSTMPTWLRQNYADTREKLVGEIAKNPSKKPTCYVQGSFFMGSSSPYLDTLKIHHITPFAFFKPSYFIWLPHLLAPRICCPHCAAAGRKDSKGNPACISLHGEIDKYSSMLSARILQIDHSFKVPKLLGRLNSIPVFSALHTSINDQYMPALGAIPTSLKLFGHSPIEVVFTDSPRADKAELELWIPSLRENIVPAQIQSASLPELSLPPTMPVLTLSSAYQINTRFGMLIEKYQNSETVYAAVDMEWPVNRESGIQGCVALVSITFGDEIFLIPLISYLRNGHLHLPQGLLTFLRSTKFRKVGVQVSGDLTRLFKDCGFSTDRGDEVFAGAFDLGKLAKEKQVVAKASVGLADLSAAILRRYLPKDTNIRVSEGWSSFPLSKAHEKYAALDAFATWAVFQGLASSVEGDSIGIDAAAGTKVALFSQDHSRVVANGFVHPDRPKEYHRINLTKTRVLITITEVIVPGYIIPSDLVDSKTPVSLSELPVPPFNLVCKAKHLRARSDFLSIHNLGSWPSTSHPSKSSHSNSCDLEAKKADKAHITPDVVSLPIPDLSAAAEQAGEPWYSDMDKADDPDADTHDSEAAVVTPGRNMEHDLTSEEYAKALDKYSFPPGSPTDVAVIRSRVLGDIWHLMHKFPISRKHGLRKPFARALRDAFFLLDPDDEANIKAFLESKGVTWKYMMQGHQEWLFKRAFGPLKDTQVKQPLFTKRAFEIAENVLDDIQRGFYSDPPGIQLYYFQGKDKNGLSVYKCCRGTNAIEGGVHQNIVRWFGAFNAGPDFAVEILRDYRLYHNLRVGYLNRTGGAYQGSFDIWTRNQISQLVDILATRFTSLPPGFGPGGWVNGNYYVNSPEVFGILPANERQREQLGMLEYHHDHGKEIRHSYLAFQQKTRNAILPVHTKAERGLFKMFVAKRDGLFSGTRQPNWAVLATQWAEHADGVKIFYKLPEHLKAYWNKWGEHVTESGSMQMNKEAYDRISALLLPPTTRPTLPAARPSALAQQVTEGLQMRDDGAVDPWLELYMKLGYWQFSFINHTCQ